MQNTEETNATENLNKKKLFIGNLEWGVDADGLKEIFSKWGEIIDVNVMRNPDGTSRGYGFVEYNLESEAETAKQEANGGEINGRTINVDYSRMSNRSDRGGDRGQRNDRNGNFRNNKRPGSFRNNNNSGSGRKPYGQSQSYEN